MQPPSPWCIVMDHSNSGIALEFFAGEPINRRRLPSVIDNDKQPVLMSLMLHAFKRSTQQYCAILGASDDTHTTWGGKIPSTSLTFAALVYFFTTRT